MKRVKNLIDFVEYRFPRVWDIEKVREKYPVTYENSLNQVLVNELQLFNHFIRWVKDSISRLRKVVKNESEINKDIAEDIRDLLAYKVPAWWKWNGFISTKSILSIVVDLHHPDRNKMFYNHYYHSSGVDMQHSLTFALIGAHQRAIN
mgnify:CR=1 FL=1